MALQADQNRLPPRFGAGEHRKMMLNASLVCVLPLI